jgi:Ca-activated chloride channel family protein
VELFFRFEQWWLLGITIPLIITAVILHRWFAPIIYFQYALAHELKVKKQMTTHPYQTLFYMIRLFVLIILALLVAKPQLVDKRSNIIVEGIDIMIVLDASGSMDFTDFSDDDRSRFDVAKEEAICFIEKRVNDAIGLVIFAKDAISRCPVTMDKKIIREIVDDLRIGVIDHTGTMLGRAIVTAINRLKHSKANNKVMILLTDGTPSEGDMNPVTVSEIAKKLGIKIYTVGIGSEHDEIVVHPKYGLQRKPGVNVPLLKQIARDTNGEFFMAHNARDMHAIYDTIDRLEKTKHESPLYSRYFDIFTPFVIACIILLGLQQLLATFRWFSI